MNNRSLRCWTLAGNWLPFVCFLVCLFVCLFLLVWGVPPLVILQSDWSPFVPLSLRKPTNMSLLLCRQLTLRTVITCKCVLKALICHCSCSHWHWDLDCDNMTSCSGDHGSDIDVITLVVMDMVMQLMMDFYIWLNSYLYLVLCLFVCLVCL